MPNPEVDVSRRQSRPLQSDTSHLRYIYLYRFNAAFHNTIDKASTWRNGEIHVATMAHARHRPSRSHYTLSYGSTSVNELCGADPMKMLLVLALLVYGSDGALCPNTKVEAPREVTLMASPSNPAQEAWIVTPTCDVTTVPVVKQGSDLVLDSAASVNAPPIDRVASVPTTLQTLSLYNQPLSKGIDVSNSNNIKNIAMLLAGGSKLDLKLSSSVSKFASMIGNLQTIDNMQFPASMTMVNVPLNQLTSLRNVKLPPALQYLTLHGNKLTSIDFNIPPRVTSLDLGNNTIGKLDGLVLPETMYAIDCHKCGLSSIQGVRWPTRLEHLQLADNPVTRFEIREADVVMFEKLETLAVQISQPSCQNANTYTKQIQGISFCIISDEAFDSLYPPNVFPDPTPEAPSPSTSSTEGSTASQSHSSASEDGELIEDSTTKAPHEHNDDSNSASTLGSSSGQSGKFDEGKASTNGDSQYSLNSTLLFVVVALGSLFVVLIAIIGYRVFFAKSTRRHTGLYDGKHLDTDGKYNDVTTPGDKTTDIDRSVGASSKYDSAATTQEYLPNDIRNDKNLLPFRIERGDVQLGKVVARGGFGMVYRGKYDGRDVAVKQMLPDTWRNDAMLASFMDEIRLCASLDHPKVVHFVGITWSSLRDLSVLTEFMTGGDLYDLLYQPSNKPDPGHWSRPWSTPSMRQLKCKAQMALDVAEAVVYLHSFPAPIIHRDLKSKNVLLDSKGNPKLSDFGISREMDLDETMTSEIGTSAWIAPEVLRGERYSEKADIYSLGVLFVELDRCCHPYTDDPALTVPGTSSNGGRKGGSAVPKSTQIAVLVSTGRLRPSMSPEAPHKIQSLVERCLVNDPDDRLSAMEVCYELRQILRGMHQQAGTMGFF